MDDRQWRFILGVEQPPLTAVFHKFILLPGGISFFIARCQR
ncbi:hypothetical protein HM1_2345 [Heliomicrobium modesticaldum Ice1]|uniref:Uncharacterized protein n=1 Tax=Heliobacterium modesticaldum (strain ATCC 51547 / Ice1) TaxID=498761 RepID=B0THU5_HELMI|nr:hypothetical protein HM1_2345 [Heliomicrobium modesticaldum Ice1]